MAPRAVDPDIRGTFDPFVVIALLTALLGLSFTYYAFTPTQVVPATSGAPESAPPPAATPLVPFTENPSSDARTSMLSGLVREVGDGYLSVEDFRDPGKIRRLKVLVSSETVIQVPVMVPGVPAADYPLEDRALSDIRVMDGVEITAKSEIGKDATEFEAARILIRPNPVRNITPPQP